MTRNEYALYCHGYFKRNQRAQEPFRRLYQLIWNANTDKSSKIRTFGSLYNHWPLTTDNYKDVLSDKEEMDRRWSKAIELTKRLKGNVNTDVRN